MRRKLLCVSAAMIMGIWCAEISLLAAAGITLAAVFYTVMLYKYPEYDSLHIRKLSLWCTVFIIVGAVRLSAGDFMQKRSLWIDSDKVHVVTGEVRQIEKEKRLNILIHEVDGKKVRSGLLATYDGSEKDLTSYVGTVIESKIRISAPERRRDPRCFDYSEYLKTRGIWHVAEMYSMRIDRENAGLLSPIKRKVISFRNAFISSIPGNDDSKGKAIIRGVLFGDTESMSEDMKDDFRRNGTAHILAVSGLHIGLLYSIFRKLRERAEIPYLTYMFFGLLFIYGTMTLWTVSVSRAVLMIVIMETGEKLNRRYDLLTSLGTVSMLVLLNEPRALFGASFIMSYLAVLSMGMIGPGLGRLLPSWFPKGLIAPVSVQAGLLPYTAYTFNVLPFGSLIINIPVIFILSILINICAASIPVYVICSLVTSLSWVFDMVITSALKVASVIYTLNSLFAELSVFSPDVPSPPLPFVFIIYAILFFTFSESFVVARKRSDLGMAGLQAGVMLTCVMLSCLVSYTPFDKADIVMVDVGQGACTHIKCGSTDVMIDGGGSQTYDVGKKVLKPYLLKNGSSDLDIGVATHEDTDHIQGLRDLRKCFPVKYFDVGLLKGTAIRLSGDVSIDVIWPVRLEQNTSQENEESSCFMISIRGVKVLVTGDLDEAGEKEVIEYYRTHGRPEVLKADVLNVGHHGSKTSTCEEFLDAVDPDIAVIQVGKNNYGHPSSEVIRRLSSHGITTFRNDRDGAVGFRIGKNGIKDVCTMLRVE